MCLRILSIARPPKSDESWFNAAADIIVREAVGLKDAVTQLSIPLTTQDCQNISRRKSFQTALRTAKIRFQAEVANAPGRNKTSTIGHLQILAEKLELEGAHDKAAEVLFKISKLENWVGEGGVVNVFGGLSQKDIDLLKKQVEERLDPATRTASTDERLAN